MIDSTTIIDEAERALGLSTEELAEKLYVPVELLSEWKKGFLPAIYLPVLMCALAFITLTHKKENDPEQKKRLAKLEKLKAELNELRKGNEFYRPNAKLIFKGGKYMVEDSGDNDRK